MFCFCKKKVGTQARIETFWFCKKEVGTNQKVLVLFQIFWNKQKRSTLGSGTHQNVLVSFRFLASISERLCFRFHQCPDPDPPSRIWLWECCWGRESVAYSLICNSLIEGFGSGSIPLTNGSGSESFYETVADEWVCNTLTASATLSQPWESTWEFPITIKPIECL